MGAVMSGNLADFSGNIPQNYDSGMGPIIFAGYPVDVAQRIASHAPSASLNLSISIFVMSSPHMWVERWGRR